MKTLRPQDLQQWKGRIVDVRNLDEFAGERLGAAECVPLAQLLGSAGQWGRGDDLLVMCKSGMRSAQAARQLEELGFTSVHMLEGGIDACKRAGVPVITGKKTIPLQRQILLGAGIVLLTGLTLSLVHPAFIAIDWFVAGMLVIAGLTGFCPMARFLGRMPWNKSSTCASGTCS